MELRVNGRRAEFWETPDEVVLRTRGSKTDQYNVGQVRNHFSTKDPEGLCVVNALHRLRQAFPARFHEGYESDLPLFRWTKGEAVRRDLVKSWLERAAVAEGVPPDRIGSHSLRIGGATALYHVTGDLDLVRRYGRWSSQAHNLYLWEAQEQANGVAEAMSKGTTTLMAQRSLGAEAAREAYVRRKTGFGSRVGGSSPSADP